MPSSESWVDEIIEVTQIYGLLALQTVTVGDQDLKVWATIPFSSVRFQEIVANNANMIFI